jgi:hypothetical protein
MASADALRRPVAGDAGDTLLLRAAVFFAVAVLIHNSDHLRRGTNLLHADLFWLGTVGIALEVVIVVLICQRNRVAHMAAALGGLVLAAGYIEAHFLPTHQWFSDSFTSVAHVSPISWFAATLEVVAAGVLALIGLLVLRMRKGLHSADERHHVHRTLGAALTHPLALVFTACQVMILLISFAQR